MYQILLVEDDRALALAVQKLLESYGSRVRCVEDFADVLGEFAACQPQLVLMDIKTGTGTTGAAGFGRFRRCRWCFSPLRRTT